MFRWYAPLLKRQLLYSFAFPHARCSASSICGSYAGESEGRLRKVFAEAAAAARGEPGPGVPGGKADRTPQKGTGSSNSSNSNSTPKSASKSTPKKASNNTPKSGSKGGKGGDRRRSGGVPEAEAEEGVHPRGALQPRPAIIFIDEIDALCPKRDVR